MPRIQLFISARNTYIISVCMFLLQALNLFPFHILFFSKYHCKTGTLYSLFSSSHVFSALEFDTKHFGKQSLWQLEQCILPPKNAITWRLLIRKRKTFLSDLDLSEAITWQLFKSLSPCRFGFNTVSILQKCKLFI